MPLFKLSVQCVLLATISVGLYAQPLRQSTASPALSAPSQQPQASKDSFAYTYFVQTGTFRSELDAQNQVDKLNGARVAADISVGSNDNRPVYRVRVGPFQNKDEYDAVASRVRARGFDPVIVRISAGSANASGTTKGAAAQTANGKSLPSDGFEVAPVQCFTTQHRPVPGSERNPNGKTENTYYVNRCTFPIIVIGCIAVKQRMNEKHQSFVESCSTRNQNGVFEMTLGAMVTDPSNPYYRQVMPGRLPAGYDQPPGLPGFAPMRTHEAFLLECPATSPRDPDNRVVRMRNVTRNSDGTITGQCVSERKDDSLTGDRQYWGSIK